MFARPELKGRPLCIALTGPNGAGKSTFYRTQLEGFGYFFVNADDLARQLDVHAYQAARAADALRRELVRQKTTFVFETVFSDPVGDKVAFLKEAEAAGFYVVLCYIGLSSAAESDRRVAMRVSKGGHDVPAKKVRERYARTLTNLKLAMEGLGDVRIFDNNDLVQPYRLVARCEAGQVVQRARVLPSWLKRLVARG